MSTVNIHLSNSDVAMLKAPVLLATVEFDLVHTLVQVFTVNPAPSEVMHIMATTHQSVFSDMNVTVPLY